MNLSEAAFVEWATADGWTTTKRGWPDFLCRRDGQLMAVEVKGPHDGLSRQQWDTINDLRAAGIPTFVWGPDIGFVEVGAPVAESVHSLRATIAEFRQLLAEKEKPKPEPVLKQWKPDPLDGAGIGHVRSECNRSHSDHPTGFCERVLLEGIELNDEELRSRGWLRTYHHARRRSDDFQHWRMHSGMPGKCTFCVDQAA